jgi:hypothetical protein
MSAGRAEMSKSFAAESATGNKISAVAMLRISWPGHGREHEQPEKQGVWTRGAPRRAQTCASGGSKE